MITRFIALFTIVILSSTSYAQMKCADIFQNIPKDHLFYHHGLRSKDVKGFRLNVEGSNKGRKIIVVNASRSTPISLDQVTRVLPKFNQRLLMSEKYDYSPMSLKVMNAVRSGVYNLIGVLRILKVLKPKKKSEAYYNIEDVFAHMYQASLNEKLINKTKDELDQIEIQLEGRTFTGSEVLEIIKLNKSNPLQSVLDANRSIEAGYKVPLKHKLIFGSFLANTFVILVTMGGWTFTNWAIFPQVSEWLTVSSTMTYLLALHQTYPMERVNLWVENIQSLIHLKPSQEPILVLATIDGFGPLVKRLEKETQFLKPIPFQELSESNLP